MDLPQRHREYREKQVWFKNQNNPLCSLCLCGKKTPITIKPTIFPALLHRLLSHPVFPGLESCFVMDFPQRHRVHREKQVWFKNQNNPLCSLCLCGKKTPGTIKPTIFPALLHRLLSHPVFPPCSVLPGPVSCFVMDLPQRHREYREKQVWFKNQNNPLCSLCLCGKKNTHHNQTNNFSSSTSPITFTPSFSWSRVMFCNGFSAEAQSTPRKTGMV